MMRWQDELTQWSITQNRTEGVTKPHPGISKMMTVFAINGLNELELAKLAGHFGEMSLSDFSTIFSGYSLDELDFDQCLAIVRGAQTITPQAKNVPVKMHAGARETKTDSAIPFGYMVTEPSHFDSQWVRDDNHIYK
ncbi:MAG: hypothetical protein KDE28_28945 [Anaerolineales bacterium]|nr:hypothetical protein [Anaerolineales bacterium]